MRTTELSNARRRLVDLMTAVDYGIIEDLDVRGGEPQLEPGVEASRDIRLGAASQPRARGSEFELRNAVQELFALFDREQNFRIARLTIQGGLPLWLRVRATLER